MKHQVLTYRITELPDPSYPPYQLAAGGEVGRAAAGDIEHLLRTLADFPAGSVSATFRFVYSPGHSEPQNRLCLYLVAEVKRQEAAESLALLMEQGPLNRFYDLEPVDDDPGCGTHPGQLNATCDIKRRQGILQPTVSAEFNAKIPPYYWSIRSFEPREDNDYLALDRVLSRVCEPVTIELRAEPADISSIINAHSRYRMRLQEINRIWHDDDLDHLTSELLSQGISDWRSNTIPLQLKSPCRKDPLADEVLREQQRLHESLTRLHLHFCARVMAQSQSMARLLASVVAESALEDGSYQLVDTAPDGSCFSQAQLSESEAERSTIDPDPYATLTPLATLAPVEELCSLIRMPTASFGSPRCIRKNTDPPLVPADDLFVFGSDEQVSVHPVDAASADKDSGVAPVPRGVVNRALTKHLFVSGIPGSGKTIATFHLLMQLHERGIPFLVIEPAKTEYRNLKTLRHCGDLNAQRLADALRVYTPGVESVSPFRHNPLICPNGIGRDEHIETVLNCFKAAMPMSGPLPGLLAEALEQVYDEHPDDVDPPVMTDLYHAAHQVLVAKGYSGELQSDLRAALEVRLGALTRRAMGQVFQCVRHGPDIAALMNAWSVCELDHLPPEMACLQTLFLLTAIHAHVRTTNAGTDGTRFVIVIEEAHNIVGRKTDATASEENADPKAFAAEFICRMLAELRALGVGIVIVDQLPSAVAPQVVKNTGSKLAFRQVAMDDREELGATMLFGPMELEEIARLRPGEAYLHTEDYHGPRRIRTENLAAQLNLGPPPLGDALVPHICHDDWFISDWISRSADELQQLNNYLNAFDDRVQNIRDRAATLLRRQDTSGSVGAGKADSSPWQQLTRPLRQLRDELEADFLRLERGPYRRLLGHDLETVEDDFGVRNLRRILRERFEHILSPQSHALMAFLDDPRVFTNKPTDTPMPRSPHHGQT